MKDWRKDLINYNNSFKNHIINRDEATKEWNNEFGTRSSNNFYSPSKIER